MIAGVLINDLYLSGGYLALQNISAATMALIAALYPMLPASLAGPILNENMRPLQWFGLTLGLAGVILVVGEQAARVESLTGALVGFAGVVCLAIGTIHYRKHCRDVNLLIANTVQLSSAGVLCALLSEGSPSVITNRGGLWVGWRLPQVTVSMSELRAFSSTLDAENRPARY